MEFKTYPEQMKTQLITGHPQLAADPWHVDTQAPDKVLARYWAPHAQKLSFSTYFLFGSSIFLETCSRSSICCPPFPLLSLMNFIKHVIVSSEEVPALRNMTRVI
jgi:hypothetical protein